MKMTLVILFNTALAHHLHGRNTMAMLQSAEDRKLENRAILRKELLMSLERATTHYRLSCRIQVIECVYLEDIVVMANVNNLGQIYAMLGDIPTSKLMFERLLSDLILCTQRLRNDEEAGRRRQAFAVFYQNTAHLILRGPIVATAA